MQLSLSTRRSEPKYVLDRKAFYSYIYRMNKQKRNKLKGKKKSFLKSYINVCSMKSVSIDRQSDRQKLTGPRTDRRTDRQTER